MPKTPVSSELKNTTYELFIAALSVLSVFNLFLVIILPNKEVEGVLNIMNVVLSIIFMADFLFRLFTASSKRHYLVQQYGWADLLASMPFEQVKVFRLFRVLRVVRLMNQSGSRRLFREFLMSRGSSALLTILFCAVLVLEFGGMAILIVERGSANANIKTPSDALWWIYVTITTVGYGDRYPVTNAGRIVGVIVMTTGIGLFGTLTGFLANFFLQPQTAKK